MLGVPSCMLSATVSVVTPAAGRRWWLADDPSAMVWRRRRMRPRRFWRRRRLRASAAQVVRQKIAVLRARIPGPGDLTTSRVIWLKSLISPAR